MAQIPQRITQSHLRLLETEPHRFGRLYSQGLEVPTISRRSDAIELGKQFHQLLQQHALGLPVSALVDTDPKLKRYFQAFQTCPPPLIEGTQLSEYPLASPWDEYQLYGIVDLLVLSPDRIQVVDWKTYNRARSRSELADDWQTLLYLYLLAKTYDRPLDQLSILYWFAEEPQQWVEIEYEAKTHARTQAKISGLLSALDRWLQSGFPPAPASAQSLPLQSPSAEDISVKDIPPLPLPE